MCSRRCRRQAFGGRAIAMKSEFRLAFDTGRVFVTIAESRKDAIKNYCNKFGTPEEWVKAHCKIKNIGRVSKEREELI